LASNERCAIGKNECKIEGIINGAVPFASGEVLQVLEGH
jgi:hypothetical protein